MKVLRCFLLGVLLAAGTSLAVDVNWLTGIVKAIRREYRLEGHFCVAAAIPFGQDANTLAGDVLHGVRFNEGMEEEAKGGLLFARDRVILAAPAGAAHAENSVLKNLNKLQKYKNDFLLIYSYLSPCSKCTDWTETHNILKHISNYINYWTDGAFVFTKVFDKPKDGSTVPRKVLKASLNELAFSMGGLQYIFRCAGPSISDLECHSCSARDKISEFCIDNNAEPHQAGSSGSERSWSESRIEGRRSRSSSRGGNRGGSRSSSESRNRGEGSSRKRHIYRSQSESSSSSSSTNSRIAGKNKGGRRMSRKRSKYRSRSESRSSRSG